MKLGFLSEAPTQDSEVMTRCIRIGAVVNAVFNLVKVCSAAGFHDRFFGPFLRRQVTGMALELKSLMK